jgi:hypothetical protein
LEDGYFLTGVKKITFEISGRHTVYWGLIYTIKSRGEQKAKKIAQRLKRRMQITVNTNGWVMDMKHVT